MKNEKVYINQILDGIFKIESFVSDMSRDVFNTDEKTQSAVIMQLILIGEISKKISDETKEKIILPWKDIVGFRDMAVHNYFNIDLDIVWNTIKKDILFMKEKLSHFV